MIGILLLDCKYTTPLHTVTPPKLVREIILVLEQVLVKFIMIVFIGFVYLYKYNIRKLDIFTKSAKGVFRIIF